MRQTNEMPLENNIHPLKHMYFRNTPIRCLLMNILELN